MALNRQPLAYNVAIVDRDGLPTPAFQRQWQSALADGGGGVPPGYYVRTGLQTGWASPTGTVSRATFATYTAPTISNPPTQAQVQAMANHLQILSQRMAAMIADLKSSQLFTS